VPAPNAESITFWEKANEDQLWIQRCKDCDQGAFFYPRFFCPKCLSKNVEWFQASGRGKLHTYMINHRAPPAFMAEAPYAIAIVELDATSRTRERCSKVWMFGMFARWAEENVDD
jgi:uncharacterized OB-fold protein